ncbi:MAG: hypothetical protein RI906_1884, partial [Pseudomonadota bacterium]
QTRTIDFNNTNAFKVYRIVFTELRDSATATAAQVADLVLLPKANWGTVDAPPLDAVYGDLSAAQRAVVDANFNYAGIVAPAQWTETLNGLSYSQLTADQKAVVDTKLNYASAVTAGQWTETLSGRSYTDLTTAQKAVVDRELNYGSVLTSAQWAESIAGLTYSQLTAAQQDVIDREVDFAVAVTDAQWGSVAKPAPGTGYPALTAAQKAVVDATLRFAGSTGLIDASRWFAEAQGAAAAQSVVAPASQTTYTNLTAAQKTIVDKYVNFAQAVNTPDWGTTTRPEPFTQYESLTAAQKAVVDSKLNLASAVSQARWAEALAGLTYTQLTPAQQQVVDRLVDYSSAISSGDWGSVTKPAAWTRYADLTAAQKAVVDAKARFADAPGLIDAAKWVSKPAQGALYAELSDEHRAVVDRVISFAPPQLDRITLSGSFVAGDTLSLTLASPASFTGSRTISYTVKASDVVTTGDNAAVTTRQNVAKGLASAINADTEAIKAVKAVAPTGGMLKVTGLASSRPFALAMSGSDARLKLEHNPFDELTQDQQGVVSEYLRPKNDVLFKDLTAGQKEVVVKAITEFEASARANPTSKYKTLYFNYNAPTGKKLVNGFTQGIVTDYENSDVFWGEGVSAPGASVGFDALDDAKKAIVARALGYEAYTGTWFYKAGASASDRLVKGFTAGGGDFDIDRLDWGGTRAPANTASFESLTLAQRDVVLTKLGYGTYDKQVFVKLDAPAGRQVVTGFTEGPQGDFEVKTFAWDTVTKPNDSTPFDMLNVQQQEAVLKSLGYQRWDGLVFYNANAAADQKFKLSFKQGTDYNNTDITWSRVAIPETGTAYSALTAQQKFVVQDQSGYAEYSAANDVYYKASAPADQKLVTNFLIDQSNGEPTGTPSKRWLISDGTNKYLAYAYDATNNGSIEELQIQEVHPLLGQRGAGFLLTGTITTLQPDSDFIVDVEDEALVVGGIIKLLGEGSDLVMRSQRAVYWQGQGTINGDITLEGLGSQRPGAPLAGTSVYVHAASTLLAGRAGADIRVVGNDDVEIYGRLIAGGKLVGSGTEWLGPDSTIFVQAGEQIRIDTALSAAKSVTLRTTRLPGADDAGQSLVFSTAGGLTAAGFTSDGSGGLVDIDVKGEAVVAGMILSGGKVTQTRNPDGRLIGETYTWSNERSTVSIRADGQVDFGVTVRSATTGNPVEVGGIVRANQNINVNGGVNADGIGVRLPGAARLIVQNADGEINIEAAQDAWLQGQMVAGGEVVDYYDTAGWYLGSLTNNFDGDSVLRIEADRQIRLGRDLLAGKVIDVRGGRSTREATSADPWADEGIVIGGNVALRTWRDDSTITLSASGDMSVLTPAWTQELLADGFAEFADGHLSAQTKFRLTVSLGDDYEWSADLSLNPTRTSTTDGLFGLVEDLQAAINATNAFKVTRTVAGLPALNSLQTLAADTVTVRMDDGRLMLTSNRVMRISAIAGGGAERLGFTQIRDSSPTAGPLQSSRGYAIDASAQGSVVNLGKANAPGGEITIAGAIRAHSALNLYAGTREGTGSQAVNFQATSLVETLSGSMVMNPAGTTVIEGDFIARGANSDIIIRGTGTLDLKGDLTAQRDIIITSGTREQVGEVSIRTFGTSRFATLDADSRIIIQGYNDVVINSTIGKGNPNLGLLQISSLKGVLDIRAESGWLETGANIVLAGKDIDIAGVVKSNQATSATYDYEVSAYATGDIRLHGTIELKGSMLAKAGDDIEVWNTALAAQETGHKLRLEAVDAISMGSVNDRTGGVVLEADSLLEVIAGGNITLGENAQLYSSGTDSIIKVQGSRVVVQGGIQAGADQAFLPEPKAGAANTVKLTSPQAGQYRFKVGAIINADVTEVAAPAGTTFSYQWQSLGDDGITWSAIAGATASTFTPTQTQNGRTIRVKVTYTVNTSTTDLYSNAYPVASTADVVWTGKNATLDLRATRDVVLGNLETGFGGQLLASGSVLVSAGTSTGGSGTGFEMSSASRVAADATGDGRWTGAAETGDGRVEIVADGDIRIKGAVTGVDVGSDLALRSRSLVHIDGLVTTQDQLVVRGGTDASKAGVWMELLVLDNAGNYVRGGTLDTSPGGSIDIEAVDSILIKGVLGQRDVTAGILGGAKVGTIRVESLAGDVNLMRNVNVRDSLVVLGNNIGVLSGSYVYATGADSTLYVRARDTLLISGPGTDIDTGENLNQAIAKGDALAHLAAPKIAVNGQVEVTRAVSSGAVTATVSVADALVDRTIDLAALQVHYGATYTVTVGSSSFSYTAAGDTREQIVEGLRAAIDADATLGATRAGQILTLTGGNSRTDAISVSYAMMGRILMNAGESLTVAGTVSSAGRIDLNSGVDLTWSRDRLERGIALSDLNGGTITVRGQGLLTAADEVRVLAGGAVRLDADASVGGIVEVQVPVYVTVAEEVPVVVDTVKVAAGQIQVPEITWVPTEITEQVGTEKVKTGSKYATMEVKLNQIGYYNPKADYDKRFREVLIEGVDYFNSTVNWNKAGNEQVPNRSVGSGDIPPPDYQATTYKAFTELSDAQRWAVLNTTGYMPIYEFNYSAYTLHVTENGTASVQTNVRPAWDPVANGTVVKDVFYVDVAGWRDKYILMPVGAQEDILSVATAGEAKYLYNDTAQASAAAFQVDGGNPIDGVNPNTWYTLDTVPAGAKAGELVGRYYEDGLVRYAQKGSAFTGSTVMGGVDWDGTGASWEVRYSGDGTRYYDIANGLNTFLDPDAARYTASLKQAPRWATPDQLAGGMINSTHSNYSGGAGSTDGWISWADWYSWNQVNGGNSTGYASAGGVTIKYTGEGLGIGNGGKNWGSDYTGSGVNNSPPTSGSEYVAFNQGNKRGRIEFSQPVVNPVIAVMSLGNSGNGAQMWFGDEDFTIVRTGLGGGWGSGSIWETWGGTVGNSAEGNGVIRFNGVFDHIDWVLADTEFYGIFTVGFDATVTAAGGTRSSSAIVAPSSYVTELGSSTRDFTYINNSTNVRPDVEVGYAPGLRDFLGGLYFYEHVSYGGAAWRAGWYEMPSFWDWRAGEWGASSWWNDRISSIRMGDDIQK